MLIPALLLGLRCWWLSPGWLWLLRIGLVLLLLVPSRLLGLKLLRGLRLLLGLLAPGLLRWLLILIPALLRLLGG